MVDEAQLGVLLEEITGAGRLEVGRRTAQIARLVNEVLVYLGPEPSGDREPEIRRTDGAPAEMPRPGPPRGVDEDRSEMVLPDGRLSLPESVAGLDAAMLMLRARREALAARERASRMPGPPERPF